MNLAGSAAGPPGVRPAGAPAPRLTAALAVAGPYFTFSTRPPADLRVGQWRRLTELFDGSGGLENHYRQVQSTLGSTSGRIVDFRVAASTGHLALVSRLLCPAIGAAALGFHLDLSELWWRPSISGPLPLCLPDDAAKPTDSQTIPMGPVVALTRATAAFSVSPRVLEGNVDSAVNGAAATFSGAVPDVASRVMAIARHLVPDAGPRFRRRSCCLIYRIAPPGSRSLCGECILGAP